MDNESNIHSQHRLPDPHFSPGLPKVQLEIYRGKARNRLRQVTVPVFLIGTADDSDLVLGDPQFPESHAYLFVSAGGVTLRQLGSGPEITVAGELVHSARLKDGDRIRTGPYEFRIRIEWPEGRRTDPAGQDAVDAEENMGAGLSAVERLLEDVRGVLSSCPLSEQRRWLRLYIEPPEPNCDPAPLPDVVLARRAST